MRVTNILGWSVLAGIVVALVVIPLWQRRVDPNKKPEFGNQDPLSIDLLIRGEQIARLTNAGDMISLLRAARQVRPHECTYQGKLLLRSEDGTTADVRLRPGHNDAYYEFHCANGLFAVPRPAFISALAAAGVDTNQIPTK